MMKKCFKYDFNYVIKTWWLAAVSLVLISFGAGWGFRNITLYSAAPDRLFILEYGLIVVYIIAAGALGILTQVLLSIRLYTNFYSEEGYLTFTLPVKRSTLLKSKVLCGFVFELLTALTIITSIVIILAMVPSEHKEYFNLLQETICEFTQWFILDIPNSEKIWFILYLFEMFLIGILALLGICTTLYMLITLGATLVKKFKIGAIIGFIVGADYVFSIISVAAGISFTLWIEAASYLFEDKTNGTTGFWIILFMFFALIVILSTVITLFVNITQGLIDRKLNLQ